MARLRGCGAREVREKHFICAKKTFPSVDPGTPSFIENDIGDNFFNVTFKPSEFDETGRGPVGNTFLVEYKESSDGEDAWKEAKQQGEQ